MNESDRPTALGPAHPDDLAASGPDPLIGTTLADTYKIERSVAEGGMGRVYEAHHTRISTKRFAIKVLHADLKHSLEVRMRFRREAEVAASVDHPSVVNVIDFGYTPDGRPYLVSDFLDGRELGALLDTGELLPVHVVVSITRQLCRALEAAHARGVVHRDLKPANVFLVGDQSDPMVKVLDFGLSRIAELAETSVTKSGIIMGTPSFMSPEQARGERADHRADIYGIGAILYACITGRAPHAEDSPHATVLAVMNRDPVRPTSIIPNLPPELEVIIERAMARDPAERYQTTRDLDQALERFEERFAGPRMPSSPPPSMLGAPRGSIADEAEANGVRRRAAFWLVLAGLLVLGGSLSAALGAFAIFAPGRELSPTELLLVSLAVFGSLFTPGVLFVRWLANRYWSSTARMMTLVVAIRGPVVAATSAYGIVTLAGRVLDAALPRVTKTISAPDASGWSGWSPFIAGVALAAAVGAMIQHRLLVQGTSWARRALAGTLAALTIGLGGAAVLFVGYRLHERAPNQIAAAGPSTPIKREEPRMPAGTGEPEATAHPVHTAPPDGPEGDSDARASKAELDEATAAGAEALTALSSTYPKDPDVLRALALALAKDKDRTSELLRVVDALFSVEPKSTEDAEIAALVKDAALKVSTSARAIEMMQTRMGQVGADMLFDIVLNQPDFRERARVAFETSEVQRNLSPALRVAYDLYTAPTCSARLGMLPQVGKDGDDRAAAVIVMQTQKSKKGCGPRRDKPCPPACAKDLPAYDAALRQIRARGVATPTEKDPENAP